MPGPGDITLVENAVHNPSEPRHFMRIVPDAKLHTASIGGRVIAESSAAVVVKEVGRDIYDPVVYFPRADVDETALEQIAKTTHCPVKGDTEYFDLLIEDQRIAEGAWSYVAGLVDGADELNGRIAFDIRHVQVR